MCSIVRQCRPLIPALETGEVEPVAHILSDAKENTDNNDKLLDEWTSKRDALIHCVQMVKSILGYTSQADLVDQVALRDYVKETEDCY